MLFTITSEVLIYDDKEDKYYVKQVEAIDYYHSKIYTDDFISAEKSIAYDAKDCVIKPYLVKFDNVDIYCGDIVEIKKGRHNHNYEVHLLDGEVLFRNIDNNIEMGMTSITNKPGLEINVTPYHFNLNRELIEISNE